MTSENARYPGLISKDLEALVPLKVYEGPGFVDGQTMVVRAFLWGNHVAFDVEDGQDASGSKRWKRIDGPPHIFLMRAAEALHRTQGSGQESSGK